MTKQTKKLLLAIDVSDRAMDAVKYVCRISGKQGHNQNYIRAPRVEPVQLFKKQEIRITGQSLLAEEACQEFRSSLCDG